MKLPSSYFDNLTANKYREYLKLLPNFHRENTQLITMLIFTFSALSFFAVFAINPTLSTIVELQKQVVDSTYTHEQLKTKINALSQLQNQYTLLETDLPIVQDAIPTNADVPISTAQIRALASRYKLTITTMRVNEVVLASPKLASARVSSFVFQLETTGEYEKMMRFAKALGGLSRIMVVESLTIDKDPQTDELVMQIRGREYFKK
jgi:Tfp pilus assembly protein PilO